MPVTTALLSRLRSLDDLADLIRALGFAPVFEELPPASRAPLGLGPPENGVTAAAIVGRHGGLRLYGVTLREPSRAHVADVCERLARAAPGQQQLLLVLGTPPDVLAVAAAVPAASGLRARQLRLSLARPSAVAAEILSGLAPRPAETALALSARAADVLAEEGLTSRFFSEFSRMHERAAQALEGVPRATSNERRDLALVMLTRVLFLYFVQARGWLAGRSDFLPSLLDTALRSGRLFHRAVFEPLCFGALATPPGARRGIARALGGVPFLNGGLFEHHALERRFPAALLRNDCWRELVDALFGRFHFTVRERDDDDAVDPEMLGRVFEGLMARDRRRRSGTYFTPRHLLRDTVALALDTALPERDADALRRVRILDPAAGSGAFLLEALMQLEARRAALLPSEDRAARRRAIVRDCLFGVDADPMAVRLAELRLWLALVEHDDATWDRVVPLPNLDRNLRQGDSLYSPLDARGRPAATRPAAPAVRAVAEQRTAYFAATGPAKTALARRLAASERALAIAETEAELHSVTARLAEAAAATGRDLFGARARRSPALIRRVSAWRGRRRELVALRRRIASEPVLPFFSYDVHYRDVIAEGGFDIVLGNPPWVRGERLSASERERLSARYECCRPHAVGGFPHFPDLSVPFVERALELARPGGTVAMVLPAKLLRAGYAGALRRKLRRDARIVHLDDRSAAGGDGFGATVFPMLAVLTRGAPPTDGSVHVRLAASDGSTALAGGTSQRELSLDPDDATSPWLALPDSAARAVRAVLGSAPSLGSTFRVRLGVKTGANEVFVRDAARAGELPAECRVPALLGRDIRPFRTAPTAVVLAAVDAVGAPLRQPPAAVLTYLRPHHAALARRADGRDAPPWALFRTELLCGRWLVVWRDLAARLEAAVVDRHAPGAAIPLNTCYGVAVPDAFTAHWLCALLNSTVLRDLAAAIAERAAGRCFRFDARTVGALPLPPRSSDPAVHALAGVGCAASSGGAWSPDDLDRLARSALGIGPSTARSLRALGAALRRDPERDR